MQTKTKKSMDIEQEEKDRYGIGGRRYYTRSSADDVVCAFSKSGISTKVVEYGINEYYVHEV